jgi:hypothetical protein
MHTNGKPNGHEPAQNGGKPKWTVMVYLAGDNNLTSNCITVLQQLEAVKYNEDVRVLACFDSNTPWPKGSRYLVINGKRHKNDNKLDWEIYNDLIITKERDHELEVPDFCKDKKRKGHYMKRTEVAEGLRRFLDWAMQYNVSSEHYMLVLYGHGPVVAGKTFLARENPPSSLRMKDLPRLLGKHFGSTRKLDILAFQNCAMNGIETAYALKDQVDYMIGSQGLVLAYGWPYERIVSALVDNLNDEPVDVTKKILKACARHLIDFSVMDRSSEQSVCDLSKLRDPDPSKLQNPDPSKPQDPDNVTKAIRKLSRVLQGVLEFMPVPDQRLSADKQQLVLRYPTICDAIRIARLEAQSFWGETFVDVYDFCERLLKKCNEAIVVHGDLINSVPDPGVQRQLRNTKLLSNLAKIIECCQGVMNAVDGMVKHSYYIGPELQYSHGLSIYFPWSMQGEPYSFIFRRKYKEHSLVSAFETYSGFDFVKNSGWAGFLKEFYRATLRKVRRAERKFSDPELKTNLSAGIVREKSTGPQEVLIPAQLQKTDSNTGGTDYEVWSNVKNYPRRYYLSPSDCPRKLVKAGCYPAGTEFYPDPNSPPVSYLGWNISEFVADVIRKKDHGRTDEMSSSETEVRSQQDSASEHFQTQASREQV